MALNKLKNGLILVYITKKKIIPRSGGSVGNSYICSQVFLENGIQKPNSKSNVLSNVSLKKCFSIILKWLTGRGPTVNSTL